MRRRVFGAFQWAFALLAIVMMVQEQWGMAVMALFGSLLCNARNQNELPNDWRDGEQ